MLRAPLLIAAVALGVRLLCIPLLGLPEDLGPDAEWTFSFEHGAVAQAILRGEGFADPFLAGTGSTAWTGPLYPALLALVLWGTGGVGGTALLLLAGINALASSLVVLPLVRLGRLLGRDRAGLLAAWLWALHPAAAPASVAKTWDAQLAALLITWAMAALVDPGTRRLHAGLVTGLAILFKPVFLPAALLVGWLKRGAGWREHSLLLGGLLLVLGPWVIRNAVVLGGVGLKFNLGVELLVGNNDDATSGEYVPAHHPSQSASELSLYRSHGEVAYGGLAMERALGWIEDHPDRFRALTLARARRLWVGSERALLTRDETSGRLDWKGLIKWLAFAGVGLSGLLGCLVWRGDRGSRRLLLGSVLLSTLPYLVTHATERYRLPVEPLLVLGLAGLLEGLSPRRGAAAPRDPSGDGPPAPAAPGA